MQNLKKNWGLPLLKRSKTGIEMTKQGYILFGKAVHILDELDSLLYEMEEEKDNYFEKLSVGFTLNRHDTFYLDTIWEYQEMHKTTKVSFVET
jgi:DNA-binding transcriptional LysR family regulator